MCSDESFILGAFMNISWEFERGGAINVDRYRTLCYTLHSCGSRTRMVQQADFGFEKVAFRNSKDLKVDISVLESVSFSVLNWFGTIIKISLVCIIGQTFHIIKNATFKNQNCPTVKGAHH